MTIRQKAKRYAREWRIALCGPRDSNNELPLAAHSVEYRLENAYLAGFRAGKSTQGGSKP